MKALKNLGFCLLVLAVSSFALPSLAQSQWQIWDTSTDWGTGTEDNVNHTDVADQIQLNNQGQRQIHTPYIWTANSANNQVAMMRTADGVVEKLISVGPNPSRTAVDVINGVVWVGNRGNSTVTKIDITSGAVVGTYTTGSAPRAIAIDNEGHVWVGNSGDNNAVKMKADGTILGTVALGSYPYGAAADGRGSVWFVCRSANKIYKVNQDTISVTAIVAVQNPYGIAVDLDGNVWTANYSPASIQKINGANGQVMGTYTHSTLKGGRGIAVDEAGDVWAADSGSNRLHKFNGQTGAHIQYWDVGSTPVGVALDAAGHIWTVCQGSNNAYKIQTNTGQLVGTYSTSGSGPYTYSDMTGFALQTFTLGLQGTWTGEIAACENTSYDPEWKSISWQGNFPPGTEVIAKVRVANDPNKFDRENWEGPYLPGDSLNLDDKKYLQVQLTLRTNDETITPTVTDLRIEFEGCCVDPNLPCDTGLQGLCAEGVQVCASGAVDDYMCEQQNFPETETCNQIDDDCDGIVDNNIQQVGESCYVPQAEGECKNGEFQCLYGVMECIGTVPAEPELCDNLDNDCDGDVDEELTRECETICEKGTEICENGFWINCDARTPEPEICDGIDNNCNGEIDEMDESGEGCDTGLKGVCAEGYYGCVAGGTTCIPAVTPSEELCDGLDNDCDGDVDEENPEGGAECITGKPGLCRIGSFFCMDAQLVCVDSREPGEEVCDGIDNDCDGAIDNGVLNACGGCGPVPAEVCDGLDNDCDGDIDEETGLCPAGQQCLEGECLRGCPSGECPPDYSCQDVGGEMVCVNKCHGVECEPGFVCNEITGECEDSCKDVSCKDGELCVNGECKKGDCYTTGCSDDEKCVSGNCVPDLCATVECKENEFCKNGECLKSCASVACPLGEECIDGECVKDPYYNIECGPDEIYEPNSGTCVPGPCKNVECDNGKVCEGGVCVDDPCLNIECPYGQTCREGQCVSAENPEGEGGPEDDFIIEPGDDDDAGDDDDTGDDDDADDDDTAADDDDNNAEKDSDEDGIPDSIEIGGDSDNPVDTDEDGTPDYLDTDSDNDGMPDKWEGDGDIDDDGEPNYIDEDSDGDGISDAIDTDYDGDGISDDIDNDANGNGIPDDDENKTDAIIDDDDSLWDDDDDKKGDDDDTLPPPGHVETDSKSGCGCRIK